MARSRTEPAVLIVAVDPSGRGQVSLPSPEGGELTVPVQHLAVHGALTEPLWHEEERGASYVYYQHALWSEPTGSYWDPPYLRPPETTSWPQRPAEPSVVLGGIALFDFRRHVFDSVREALASTQYDLAEVQRRVDSVHEQLRLRDEPVDRSQSGVENGEGSAERRAPEHPRKPRPRRRPIGEVLSEYAKRQENLDEALAEDLAALRRAARR